MLGDKFIRTLWDQDVAAMEQVCQCKTEQTGMLHALKVILEEVVWEGWRHISQRQIHRLTCLSEVE